MTKSQGYQIILIFTNLNEDSLTIRASGSQTSDLIKYLLNRPPVLYLKQQFLSNHKLLLTSKGIIHIKTKTLYFFHG
jgi:hypothetical protein